MGAALNYSCSEGFNLVGTASQECLPTGEWSSSTPLCMQGESLEGLYLSVSVEMYRCAFCNHIYACMCVCVYVCVCVCVCACVK